jgi:hypothetical protein
MGEAGRLYFAIGVDVDPDLADAFNEWYDTDHLPTVVGCPGFLGGCRYEARGEGLPRFWAVYEVESKAALKTPELAAISGFGRFEEAIVRRQILWLTSLTPVILHGA